MGIRKPTGQRERRITSYDMGLTQQEISDSYDRYVKHLEMRGKISMVIFGTALFVIIGVVVFVPGAAFDEKHVEEFAKVAVLSVVLNGVIGAIAVYVKKRIGHWWGIVEIAGAALAGIAVVVQVMYGSRTDYGVLLLAELAAIFGIVKGVDTYEKGTVQENKPE